jgi:hypothetical protein
MRRIIGTIGATLAVVAAVATPAAAQDRDRGRDRDREDARIFYATSVAGENLRLNVDEGTLLAGDGNLNPGTPQIVGSAYTN